jgi:hypothetical protein
MRSSIHVALVRAAGLFVLSLGTCASSCGNGGPPHVMPCPDHENMYRDYTQPGDPCLCVDPTHYVLNTDGTKCILCTGSCDGKKCGDDGCGRLTGCGDCPMGYNCDPNLFECVKCMPDCNGRQCGDDGCGHSCGTCPDGSQCDTTGTCTSSTGSGGGQEAAYCCTPYGWCPLVQPIPAGAPCYCVSSAGYFTGSGCSP